MIGRLVGLALAALLGAAVTLVVFARREPARPADGTVVVSSTPSTIQVEDRPFVVEPSGKSLWRDFPRPGDDPAILDMMKTAADFHADCPQYLVDRYPDVLCGTFRGDFEDFQIFMADALDKFPMYRPLNEWLDQGRGGTQTILYRKGGRYLLAFHEGSAGLGLVTLARSRLGD